MEALENRYKNELGEAYHANKHFLNDEVKAMMAETRVKKFLKYINPDTLLLEYGIGGGFNIKNIICKEKHGFDIATSIREQIESMGIKFFCKEEDVPNKHYDVIICHHVLEHVPNPPETLSIIKSKLKDDGRLILVLPYEYNWRFSKFDKNDKNFHLYAWNVQTLTYLVSQVGYECVETQIRSCGYDRFTSALISKYHLPKFAFGSIFTVLNFLRPAKEIFLVLKKAN
jgi:SAM-dependent methyltransferase